MLEFKIFGEVVKGLDVVFEEMVVLDVGGGKYDEDEGDEADGNEIDVAGEEDEN